MRDFYSKLDNQNKKEFRLGFGFIFIFLFFFILTPFLFPGLNSGLKSEIIEKNKSSSSPSIVKYDWCYPSCGDDVVSSFKFSSDGTFNSSTIMFGGMSRWGTWEEIDNNTFRLTTTRGLNSGNDQLPEPQIVKLISKKKLQVGSTIYIGE